MGGADCRQRGSRLNLAVHGPRVRSRVRNGISLITALAMVLLVCACEAPEGGAITGYAEALYLRPAAASGGGGSITSMHVERGDSVKAGQAPFALDAEREHAGVNETQTRLEAQSARLADLEKGRRPQEIAVIRAQLQQAEAQQRLSAASARRQTELAQRNVVSVESLDPARTAQARDAARVTELARQLEVATLAGREDALQAARLDVASATAALKQARWVLAQNSVVAPAAGSVEDVYFRAGEVVGSGVPLLALLPPANTRLRFFVPQSRLAEFAVGSVVLACCDGCAQAVQATVRYVAAQAEFAPHVLFDRRKRERLVFRVEALPSEQDAAGLHPGKPMDIVRASS